MHKLVLVLLIGLVAPNVYANCGNTPGAPAILNSAVYYLEELTQHSDEMEVYDSAVMSHLDCLEGQVTGLTPDSGDYTEEFIASDAYYSTPEYQAYQNQFDAMQQGMEGVRQLRDQAFDQHHQLSTNAVSAPAQP